MSQVNSDAPLPTVTVKGQNGEPLRINLSDYEADPKAYKLVDALVPPPAPAPASAASDTPKVLVTSEGAGARKRFYLTDQSGAKLSGEGIAEGGYDTDAAAWAAAIAL